MKGYFFGAGSYSDHSIRESISAKCEKGYIFTNEPRHGKICLCHMLTTKAQISLRFRSLISAFVVRCLDSIIHLLAKSKISRL